MPKKGKRGLRSKKFDDIKGLFRDLSDIASVRSKDTRSIQVLTPNLEH